MVAGDGIEPPTRGFSTEWHTNGPSHSCWKNGFRSPFVRMGLSRRFPFHPIKSQGVRLHSGYTNSASVTSSTV